MTELFFEGAEPNLDEFPLDELLALFPEVSTSSGLTVYRRKLVSSSTAVARRPERPRQRRRRPRPDYSLVISWDAVTSVPPGFPARPISIVGYQLIVKPFQVTVPAR